MHMITLTLHDVELIVNNKASYIAVPHNIGMSTNLSRQILYPSHAYKRIHWLR